MSAAAGAALHALLLLAAAAAARRALRAAGAGPSPELARATAAYALRTIGLLLCGLWAVAALPARVGRAAVGGAPLPSAALAAGVLLALAAIRLGFSAHRAAAPVRAARRLAWLLGGVALCAAAVAGSLALAAR